MSSIYVANHVTLDGVIQGPGRAEEDTRGGFTRGGWAQGAVNDEVAAVLGERVVQAGGMRLLLGRRSYDDMLGHWNIEGGPFKEGLNSAQKYVVSRNPETVLAWPNSTLISRSVVAGIRALTREPGADLCIMGSGELVRTLLEHGLIDELLLFVHPLVLGQGQRLFPDRGPAVRLRQLRTQGTSTGVTIAHYLVERDTPRD
jgi:dihydrofolate reductase